MSKLEDLVPKLDLCKQIPEGAFEDSALTWNEGYVKGNFVIEQRGFGLHYIAPAPTLQEILAEIPDVTVNYDGRGRWAVQAILPSRAYGDCNANPATVALKVWLARHTETPLSWFPND